MLRLPVHRAATLRAPRFHGAAARADEALWCQQVSDPATVRRRSGPATRQLYRPKRRTYALVGGEWRAGGFTLAPAGWRGHRRLTAASGLLVHPRLEWWESGAFFRAFIGTVLYDLRCLG